MSDWVRETIGDRLRQERTIHAARYLGVAPWELEQHPEWQERALRMMRREQSRQGRAKHTVSPSYVAEQAAQGIAELTKGGE